MTTALLPGAPADHPADHPTDRPAIRVLVADDNSAIRTLARFALSERLGFAVVAEATNGSEAVSLFEEHRPDCVVLDVDMPVMSGFEALAELHRRSPVTPVVMLSGFVDQQSTDRAMGGGAAAYLDKASQLTILGDTVRRVTTEAVRPDATPSDRPRAVVATASDPSPGDAAQAAARADLQRFEYVVSHDLAEPIRIMRGFAGLLDSRYAGTLDATGQAYLGHIVAAAARGQAMIDDLLVYSRAGRREPQPQRVSLAEAVTAACEQLAALIRERGAELTIDDLPGAHCDPELTTTILRELIENAITFNTAAVPRVHITGATRDGVAVLSVTDNGIGMTPVDCTRVLDLFQRLHARDAYPGTGTGLALCRRLTDSQGGTLALGTDPGGGTTATLALPATDPLEGTP